MNHVNRNSSAFYSRESSASKDGKINHHVIAQENLLLKKMISEKEKLLEFQSEQMKQMQTNLVSTMKRSSSVNNEIIDYNRKLQQELSQLREQLTILQHYYNQKVAAHNVICSDLQSKVEKLESELLEVRKERNELRAEKLIVEKKNGHFEASGVSEISYESGITMSETKNKYEGKIGKGYSLRPRKVSDSSPKLVDVTKPRSPKGYPVNKISLNSKINIQALKDPFEFKAARPKLKPSLPFVQEERESEISDVESKSSTSRKLAAQKKASKSKAKTRATTGAREDKTKRVSRKREEPSRNLKRDQVDANSESARSASTYRSCFLPRHEIEPQTSSSVTFIDLDSPVSVLEKPRSEKVELIDLCTPEEKSGNRRSSSPPESNVVLTPISERKIAPLLPVAAIVRGRRQAAQNVSSYKEPSLRSKLRRNT